MKLTILALLTIFSAQAFALDGIEFVNCYRKAINETLKKYKSAPEQMNSEDDLLDMSVRACERLPKDLYVKLIDKYSENVDGIRVATEEEDMHRAKLKWIYNDLRELTDCYEKRWPNYTGVISDFIVNKPTEKRNIKLNRDAFEKMLGVDNILENLHLTLGNEKFNLSYCQNN